jgi:3-deoxy-7-phosphoheptulonate synthase
VLLQMSLVLVHGGGRRVTRIGRFAGQYAKPRSSDTETREGMTLPSYRGDLVNDVEFSAAARTPDPTRMVRGYERAGLTLNFVRGLIDGGFADLHHPEYWDLGFVEHSPRAREYREIVSNIGEALRFMETLTGRPLETTHRVDFFSSHEALILPYEEAQTRRVPRREGWYNLTTHFPWVGMRTVDPEGAHIEYLRGIRNPVGVKVGAGLDFATLRSLLDRLDPEREPGRLTLIHRMGAAKIGDVLPSVLRQVADLGHEVLWVCDPMHGNTRTASTGFKTRSFEDILSELELAFEVHADVGTRLGGVHIELTGEDVTECVGGARGLDDQDLERAYRTQVDPRLNADQALELALRVARRMRQARPQVAATTPRHPAG